MCRMLIWTLVVVMSLSVMNCSPPLIQENAHQRWSGLNRNLLDDSTIKILELWRTDSLGCMNVRQVEHAGFLIEKFNLEIANKDSVLKVLGKPNTVISYETDDEETHKEVSIDNMIYFIHSWCEDGLPKGNGREYSVGVKINTATNKVVEISSVTH